jgi:hypothetical protein
VRLLELKLTLYQLPRDDATVLVGLEVPAAALHSVTYTSDEISVLTSLDLDGSEVERRCMEKEPGWKVFKIKGPLDLSMTGEVRHIDRPSCLHIPRRRAVAICGCLERRPGTSDGHVHVQHRLHCRQGPVGASGKVGASKCRLGGRIARRQA